MEQHDVKSARSFLGIKVILLQVAIKQPYVVTHITASQILYHCMQQNYGTTSWYFLIS